MTLQSLITQTLIQAALLATLVATATQAARRWIPRIDGWITVVVVVLVSAGTAYLFLGPETRAEWLAYGQIAVCTVALALGGDSMAQKLASKAAPKVVNVSVSEPDQPAKDG